MTRRNRTSGGSATAEFVISLFVLLLIFALPLVNALGLAVGGAIGLMASRQMAYTASTQRRYSDSLAQVYSEAQNLQSTGFARFIRLVPVNGYQNCGADLFIDSSNYVSGGNKRFGPNIPVPPPIDTSSNIYECTIHYTYQIGPIVDLHTVPFIGGVPGLGKPCVLTMNSSRSAEYPRGLEYPSGNLASAAGGGGSVMFDTNPSMPFSMGSQSSGWNYPTLYKMIQNAGETVVDDEVISVPGNANASAPASPQWTNTGITVASNQKVWIDLRADGAWSDGTAGTFNANGTGVASTTGPMVGQPCALLLGKIGTNPIFICGEDKLNYAANGQSGPLYLMMNDNYSQQGYTDNTGEQIVRVVLAQ